MLPEDRERRASKSAQERAAGRDSAAAREQLEEGAPARVQANTAIEGSAQELDVSHAGQKLTHGGARPATTTHEAAAKTTTNESEAARLCAMSDTVETTTLDKAQTESSVNNHTNTSKHAQAVVVEEVMHVSWRPGPVRPRSTGSSSRTTTTS